MCFAKCLDLRAAVFDGHSGFAAAQYLSEHLYDCFSDAIDEGSYGPECSYDGDVLLPALFSSTLMPISSRVLSCLYHSAAAIKLAQACECHRGHEVFFKSWRRPQCDLLSLQCCKRRERDGRDLLSSGAEPAAGRQLSRD